VPPHQLGESSVVAPSRKSLEKIGIPGSANDPGPA
jgi:hypothetical protein